VFCRKTLSDLKPVTKNVTASQTNSGEEVQPIILVVDDDYELRALVEVILRRSGYRVVGAASGAQAHALAVVEPPDLVLMDIGMPDVDGLSTIWKMRENSKLAEIPVVIITAYDSYDLRGEAASAGCKGYLTKPFDPDQLREVVRSILDE
jgi:DNA-binding response OmpR family regulator